MMFTSVGIGQFITGTGHIIDVMNDTCLCRGWWYKKHCKHLDYFKDWGYKKL